MKNIGEEDANFFFYFLSPQVISLKFKLAPMRLIAMSKRRFFVLKENKKQLITSIYQEEDVIIITFEGMWYQEDTPHLQQRIFDLLGSIQVQEKIMGADRECTRFLWQKTFCLLLHFDYYSQSCWFESQEVYNEKPLAQLLISLRNNLA